MRNDPTLKLADSPRPSSTANTKGWRIASVSKTRNGDRWITWWMPNNGGYAEILDEAGIYELEDLLADDGYYGRVDNVVVPDFIVRRLAERRVPNNLANWRALNLASLFWRFGRSWPAPWDEKAFRADLKRTLKSFNERFPRGALCAIDTRQGEVIGRVETVAKLRGEVPVVSIVDRGLVRCADVSQHPMARRIEECAWGARFAFRRAQHPNRLGVWPALARLGGELGVHHG